MDKKLFLLAHIVCNAMYAIAPVIKRPARDACLCMGELQAPAAPHFVFLITL